MNSIFLFRGSAALSGVETSPGEIEITTLEGVLFLARKNDLGFTVRNRILVISEHQSTLNPNMPLRSILYYGRTMEKLLRNQDLYRAKRIEIPTPEFYCFYNGVRPLPPEETLKLSDAYLEKTDKPMLELTVKMININLPVNHKILRECMPLYEYSWFMQKIRTYLDEEKSRDEAVNLAIRDCIREGIFADFVKKHGSDVENMLFTQFNMDDALAVRYEEGVEDGIERGKAVGSTIKLIQQIQKKLQKGLTPEEIAEDLEEPPEHVKQICKAIGHCGIKDAEAIYQFLQDCQSE